MRRAAAGDPRVWREACVRDGVALHEARPPQTSEREHWWGGAVDPGGPQSDRTCFQHLKLEIRRSAFELCFQCQLAPLHTGAASTSGGSARGATGATAAWRSATAR